MSSENAIKKQSNVAVQLDNLHNSKHTQLINARCGSNLQHFEQHPDPDRHERHKPSWGQIERLFAQLHFFLVNSLKMKNIKNGIFGNFFYVACEEKFRIQENFSWHSKNSILVIVQNHHYLVIFHFNLFLDYVKLTYVFANINYQTFLKSILTL